MANNESGAFTFGTKSTTGLTGILTIQDFNNGDGLANVLFFGEAAGRQQVYLRGGAMLTPNAPGQVGWTLNAAFFDYNTTIEVRGFSADGVTVDGGCNAINVTNGRTTTFTRGQFYSFHHGGVNVVKGDRVVYFLKDSTPATVLAAMVTRNGSEVFTEP